MMLTVLTSSVTAFVFTICLLYTLGDYQAALSSPTGLPIIEVIYAATKSVAATDTLMSMTFVVIVIGNFSNMASVSRLAWAFARDGGLPYSNFFSYVSSLTFFLDALNSSTGPSDTQDPTKCACFSLYL
jgi:choline transport protein